MATVTTLFLVGMGPFLVVAQSIPSFPTSFDMHVYIPGPVPGGATVYNLAVSHELNTMEFGLLGGPPENEFVGFDYSLDFTVQKAGYSFMNATFSACYVSELGRLCNSTAKVTLADRFWRATKPLGKQKGCVPDGSQETLFCWNGTVTAVDNCPVFNGEISDGMFNVFCWPADGTVPFLPTCVGSENGQGGSVSYTPMTISATDPSPMSKRSTDGCSTAPPAAKDLAAPTFFKRLLRR
jgi:hypothetical protein